MLEEVKKSVFELLDKEDSGHGVDHVLRVYNLALEFAKLEGANPLIVGLAALLHDVDDYKIVGKEQALKLTNTRNIMNKNFVSKDIQLQVIEIIKNMGYSNYLKGVRPHTLEGMIVSDADMCDAIGANGIIRSVIYAVSSKGNGVIFNKNIFPNINITALEYNNLGTTYDTDNAINHFFEKLLKLSNLMMTKSGISESLKRQEIMIQFLEEFFREENVSDWSNFLKIYLENINCKK